MIDRYFWVDDFPFPFWWDMWSFPGGYILLFDGLSHYSSDVFSKKHPKGGSYVRFLNHRSMLSPWSLASPPVSLVSTIFCLKPTSWDPPWRDSKGCGFTYPFYRKILANETIRWNQGLDSWALFGTQLFCKPKSSTNKIDLSVNNLDLLVWCLEKVKSVP